MKNKIFIVLPVFNRLKFTKKCLSAIFKQTYKNFTVVLIDDGSSDNTSEYVKNKFPKVVIIKGNGNWWWTKSMAMGVKYSLKKAKATDYILEMNNDLYFGKNYLSQLIHTAHNYPNSIIGSICVRAQKQKEVVEAGIRIDWPTGHVYGVAQTISKQLNYYKNMDVVKDLDALPGKGTLIPVTVFKKVGNFNYKKLPHYIADYEFTNRAKKKGFELIVDTKAIANHYWEATGFSFKKTSKSLNYSEAVKLLFGRKSMNNIIDWLNFIILACPKKYILRNYYFSFLKIIKALLYTKYFQFLLPVTKMLTIIYHSFNYPKLALYRLSLKIKQFPEYHLKK